MSAPIAGRAFGEGEPSSSQRRVDAREKLVGAERFDDVVVGAEAEAAYFVGLFALRRDHHDR